MTANLIGRALVCVAAAFVVVVSHAAETDVSAKYLKARLSVSPAVASPGQRVTLTIDVTPGERIHVYAPGQDGYIPISVKVKASTDFTAGPARFPAPRPFYFEPLKETVKIYDRPFRIIQEVTIATSAAIRRRANAKGTVAVAATITYQACDDAVCYKPDTAAIRWTIPLAPAR